jgi:hypothetical protein
VRHDIATKQESDVATVQGLRVFEVSPDGRWIAAATEGTEHSPSKLLLIPSGGGPPVEWLTGNLGEQLGGMSQLAWTPDSEGLLLTKRSVPGSEVWHVRRQGEARKLVVDVEDWPVARPGAPFRNSFSLSPDGRTVAFLAGTTAQEVWSLDNMLPGKR